MINIIRKKPALPPSDPDKTVIRVWMGGGRQIQSMYTSILLIISVYTVYTQTAENLIFAYRDSLHAGEHGEAMPSTSLRPACQD
jgi:hypothetical protein